MSETQAKSVSEVTTYDEMPYLSKAFFHTSPEHLRTIAKIFGVDAPKTETARILELGCASGGNIIAFAMNNTNAEVIGVDLSSKEVEYGNKDIKSLGIKNLQLKAMSIMDIDKSYGEFDYIICHGVFSWVPKEVQDKILEIMGAQLKPNGVAFVSYNTLPGWNAVNSFRHMLQFHSRYFNTDKDRVNQSRALLAFMQEALDGSDSPYAKLLENEISIIERADDSFLFHEYIIDGNTEIYFSDFMELAAKRGLSYLADASLAAMNLGNLPAKAAAKLAEVNDIIKLEQYMDFVNDRRFRNTLLCGSDTKINRNISADVIKDMFFRMGVSADTPAEKVNFQSKNFDMSFKLTGSSGSLNTTNPTMAATIYAFAYNSGAFLNIEDIKSFISKNCNGVEIDEASVNFIFLEFIKLIFSGLLHARATKPNFVTEISSLPKASDLVLHQIKTNQPYIFSQLNESIVVSPLDRIIIGGMNGKNNVDALVKILDDTLEKYGQHLELEGKRVTDEKLKIKLQTELVVKSLHFAKVCGFLVA